MKTEQKRIASELETIDRQLATATNDHQLVIANLETAPNYTRNVGAAYLVADDKTRRQINQAILKRVLITEDGITGIQFTKVFELLLDPALIRQAQTAKAGKSSRSASRGKQRPTLSLAEVDRLWELITTNYRPQPAWKEQTPKLAKVGGSNNDRLVGRKGLEPLTPCASCRCSSQLS